MNETAPLSVAGPFLYPYGDVILRDLSFEVQVGGRSFRADVVLRMPILLPDGLHLIHEVVICDGFDAAVWSTRYMAGFSYSVGREQYHAGSGPCFVRCCAHLQVAWSRCIATCLVQGKRATLLCLPLRVHRRIHRLCRPNYYYYYYYCRPARH